MTLSTESHGDLQQRLIFDKNYESCYLWINYEFYLKRLRFYLKRLRFYLKRLGWYDNAMFDEMAERNGSCIMIRIVDVHNETMETMLDIFVVVGNTVTHISFLTRLICWLPEHGQPARKWIRHLLTWAVSNPVVQGRNYFIYDNSHRQLMHFRQIFKKAPFTDQG